MTAADVPELVLQGGSPIDEQLVEQLRDHIRAGRLRPGDELPSLRALAVGLAVSPEAVRKALDRLEQEAYLTTAEGSGIFVACLPAADGPAERWAELSRLCREFLATTCRRGFTADEVRAALDAVQQGDRYHACERQHE